jgi:hypothetical protein
MIKTIKRIVIIAILLVAVQPAFSRSEMPPGNVGEGDNDADVIIIGEVFDTGAALLMNIPPARPGVPPLHRFVVLKVVNIIRGDGRIKPDTLMQVLPQAAPGRTRDRGTGSAGGMAPIRAERGTLVVMYADALPRAPGFYSYRAAFPIVISPRVMGPW